MYNRDRARFDAADIDKDGKLTEGEFLLFKNPLKDENVKAVVIDEALKAVDTDGDGKISLEEYLNDWHVKVRQLNNANCFWKKVPILSTNFARVIAKKTFNFSPQMLMKILTNLRLIDLMTNMTETVTAT